MQPLQEIYQNEIGMSFFWCNQGKLLQDKVQLIFKETGFYLSAPDLYTFAKEVDSTCSKICCSDCELKSNCQRYLLRTPFEGMELAVLAEEALQIKDLVEGTLFQIQLHNYLVDLCKN